MSRGFWFPRTVTREIPRLTRPVVSRGCAGCRSIFSRQVPPETNGFRPVVSPGGLIPTQKDRKVPRMLNPARK